MSERYEHPLGFSCEDMDDRCADLELVLADALKDLGRIQEWLAQCLLHHSDVIWENDEPVWALIEDCYAVSTKILGRKDTATTREP